MNRAIRWESTMNTPLALLPQPSLAVQVREIVLLPPHALVTASL